MRASVVGLATGTRLGQLILALVLALSAIRLVTSGVFRSSGQFVGEPTWFPEQLPPLLRLIEEGRPITAIDARQYGPVAFLLIDPFLRVFGPGPAVDLFTLLLTSGGVAGSFVLLVRRFFPADRSAQVGLVILWANFVPLLVTVANRSVDGWQTFLLSLSLFLLTAGTGVRRWAGVPVGVGLFVKLLPGFVLGYLAVREWRIAAIGAAAAVPILVVGHLLYGPLLGLGYPFALMAGGEQTITKFSTHWENNSLRGLLYKAAVGFEVETIAGTSMVSGHVRESAAGPVLNAVALAIAAVLITHVAWAALRGRRDASVERRSLEFGLAITTMLVVSPLAVHEHMVMMLPALTVLLFLWLKRSPRAWPRWLVALGAAGSVLIGVFIPVGVAALLLRIDALMELTSNADLAIPLGIGGYDLFGFAGIGLLFIWATFALLERSWPLPAADAATRPTRPQP